MRRFLTYESDQIPLAKLPYSFKRRLTALAPLDDLNNIRQTCFEYNELCSQRPEERDQLYVTDDEIVHEWASKKVFVFSIFKFIYWILRWLYDGTSFHPTWHSVLSVDNIVRMGRPIYVSDTLVLHCCSVASFERLIPYICGSYTRLTIHGGDIKLDQLRRLMKGTVRKVDITAFIRLQSDEHDDAVQLIMQHVRGYRYNFNLNSTPQLITEVKAAVPNNRYLHVKDYRGHHCNIIHKTMYLADNCFLLITFVQLIISGGNLFSDVSVEKQSSDAETEVQSQRSDAAIIVFGVLTFLRLVFSIIMIFMLIFFFALSPTLKSKPNDG